MLLAFPIAAQEQTPIFRDEIVVAAERSPEPQSETTAAVSVITRKDIEARPVETLAESLESIPGFHVLFSSASGSVPVLASRGFFGGGEVEYVQVRVDGVPMGDMESGLVDLSRFRARAIDRIEVLRGAGSALYGDTALGGVIDVTTRSDAARSALASVTGGSFSSFSIDLSLDFRPWHLSLAHAGGDGYRDGSDHQLDNLDLRWKSVDRPTDRSAAFSFSRRRVQDPGLLSRKEIEADPTQTLSLFRFDEVTTDRYRVAAGFSRAQGANAISGDIYGAYKNSDSIRTLLIAAGFGDTIARALETSAGGGSVRGEHASRFFGRDLRTRAGLDLGYETLSSRYRAVGPDGTVGPQLPAGIDGNRRRAGLYVTEELRMSGSLSIQGGIRFDRIDDEFRNRSRSDQAWSPRLGLNARVHASEESITSLFAQISRAFKAPTPDQRFDARPFPDFQGGTFTISNPELRPQNAESLEIGVSHHQQRFRGQLALYRTEVDDEIDFDAATFVYRNIGRSVHQGLEVSLRMEGAAVDPRIDYAWSRVWIPSLPDNQLKNMPEHLLRAGATFEFPFQMRLDLAGRWIAGRYLDDANTVPMSDVTLFDLRLQYAAGSATANLDVRNLGDEHYEEIGVSLPDFQGNSIPYAYPGAGREWRVGFRVEF